MIVIGICWAVLPFGSMKGIQLVYRSEESDWSATCMSLFITNNLVSAKIQFAPNVLGAFKERGDQDGSMPFSDIHIFILCLRGITIFIVCLRGITIFIKSVVHPYIYFKPSWHTFLVRCA
jgi:hypothetical protein